MVELWGLAGKKVKISTTVSEEIYKFCKEHNIQISRLIEIGYRKLRRDREENHLINQLREELEIVRRSSEKWSKAFRALADELEQKGIMSKKEIYKHLV